MEPTETESEENMYTTDDTAVTGSSFPIFFHENQTSSKEAPGERAHDSSKTGATKDIPPPKETTIERS